MALRSNCLYIYTDGSSFQKPRRGGIAIRFVFLDENEVEQRVDIEPTGYKGATNNQMELMAVIEALKELSRHPIPIYYNLIEVRTDSKYVVDNKNRAIYTWAKQKWLNNYGKPIDNATLWKELFKTIKATPYRIDFVWVKGHAKDQDNKAVDKRAKSSTKSILNKPIYTVKIRRKKSSQITVVGCIEMIGQRVSIYIITEQYLNLQKLSKYRYEIISKGSVDFGKIDFAYSELHHLKAGHKYYVIFNKDTKNPRILKLISEVKV